MLCKDDDQGASLSRQKAQPTKCDVLEEMASLLHSMHVPNGGNKPQLIER